MTEEIERQAARQALELRRSRQLDRSQPTNPFDLASSCGVSIKYLDLKTLEGGFVRDPSPLIILPSYAHRPRGRISFSCAHELGHFMLGHGTSADKVKVDIKDASNPSHELGANTFASWLLMPRQAVTSAFERRSINMQHLAPIHLLLVANELGVSLEALVNHIAITLKLLGWSWWKRATKLSVQSICKDYFSSSISKSVIVLDRHSIASSLDIEVNNDVAFMGFDPSPQLFSMMKLVKRIQIAGEQVVILRATKVGETKFNSDSAEINLRVCRSHFTGLHQYRYLPDEDCDACDSNDT